MSPRCLLTCPSPSSGASPSIPSLSSFPSRRSHRLLLQLSANPPPTTAPIRRRSAYGAAACGHPTPPPFPPLPFPAATPTRAPPPPPPPLPTAPPPPLPLRAPRGRRGSAGGGGGGEEAARKADKSRQLQKRVLVGAAIGVGADGVVVAGGWVFSAVLAGAREYFELVRSTAGGSGTPPPRYVFRVCSAICALMPILTL